ncbi:MAG: glycoside hydrolase family 5 protein [Treponema sp.]|nr:glycoside hydrolase family 5 protein [Treponema sp.]
MKKLQKLLMKGTVLAGICLCYFGLISCENSTSVNGGNENQTNEKEIAIGNDYWIAEGKGSYDKTSQTLNLSEQYADFALTPEYEAKGKFICIEYENLEGMFVLYAIYDEGDNNYYNEGNPCSTLTLKASDTSAYLKLDESKLESSKKMKIKLNRRNKEGNATIKIKKMYFTDKTYNEEAGTKEAIIDKGSPVSFNNSISSIDLVKDMGVGFNLGNCYEAHNGSKGKAGTNSDADSYLDWDGAGYWSSYSMSKDVINDLGAKFGTDSNGKSNAKTIRIPVTWYNHIIDDKYTIDPYWMENVKKAVDCAYELGYYVIINSHHDTPEISETIKYHQGYLLRDTPEDIAESERFLKAIWEQICKAFNNSYDEHLIFETMNEPLNPDDEHWGVQAGCELCLKEAELANQFNQLVLYTIRASGGNNAKRFVLIPNVGCQFDSGINNDISLEADIFKMPVDSANDKLILTVHKYPMWDHLWKEQDYDYPLLLQCFENLNSNFVEKGIPVVIGEIGPTANADINNKDSLPAKLGHILTAEEVYPPLSDLAKLAGKYGMCILDFHLGDLFLQLNGKYLPEILVDDWKSQ